MTPLIHIDRTAGLEVPDDGQFRRWISAALEGAQTRVDVDATLEVSIRINNVEEMADLNQHYRHKAGPTNVLAFPAALPEAVACNLIGDIVICAPVVIEEAQQQHKTPLHHWAHITVHGLLHLLGFDHVDDADAQQMESLEIAILRHLGLPNPYLCTSPATLHQEP